MAVDTIDAGIRPTGVAETSSGSELVAIRARRHMSALLIIHDARDRCVVDPNGIILRSAYQEVRVRRQCSSSLVARLLEKVPQSHIRIRRAVVGNLR
jgi:hypothetical protein